MSNVPVTAHLYHLDGEVDPNTARHGRAIRRNRWWILGAALGGALIMGALTLGQDYTGSASLQLPTSAPDLEAVGLSLESMTGTIDGNTIKSSLDQDEIESEAEAAAGGAISVTVTDATVGDTVRTVVAVSSDNEDAVNTALVFYGSEYDDVVAAEVAESTRRLAGVLDTREQSALNRLDDLDTQLSDPEIAETLADALTVERVAVEAELRQISDQQSAIQDFASQPVGSVAITEVESVGGGPIPFIAGGLLGALIAVLIVLTTSFLNKRVVGRGSIESSVGAPILAVVSLSTPSHMDTLAFSLANQLHERSIILTPADTGSAAQGAQALAAGLAERGFEAPTVIQPPQLGLQHRTDSDNSMYILVVTAGKTQVRDFSLAASTLTDSGCQPAGTVIITKSLATYRDVAA